MRKVSISILFMLVSLTWGTTWLAMRIAVETIPPVFATGMRFMFAAPFLIIIAWLRKKNTVVSSRTTIIPVCDLHLLFFYSFLTNDLWWNLCQLWACRHYLCEYACGRFDSIGFVSKWKSETNADRGLNYRNHCIDGDTSWRNEYKYRESLAGYHCAYFCCVNPCHNIYTM